MNDHLVTKKICPSCNQLNNPENNYCRGCGTNLENIEPQIIENVPMTDNSDINEVVITEDLKITKYGSICCVLILLGMAIGLILILMLNEDDEAIQSYMVPVGIFLISILLIPFIVGSLIYLLYSTRKMGKARTFCISDREIKIILPNKPLFKVEWSEIDGIQGRDTYTGFITNKKAYRLNFLLYSGSKRKIVLTVRQDFKNQSIKKIKELINQYANRLGKLIDLR